MTVSQCCNNVGVCSLADEYRWVCASYVAMTGSGMTKTVARVAWEQSSRSVVEAPARTLTRRWSWSGTQVSVLNTALGTCAKMTSAYLTPLQQVLSLVNNILSFFSRISQRSLCHRCTFHVKEYSSEYSDSVIKVLDTLGK